MYFSLTYRLCTPLHVLFTRSFFSRCKLFSINLRGTMIRQSFFRRNFYPLHRPWARAKPMLFAVNLGHPVAYCGNQKGIKPMLTRDTGTSLLRRGSVLYIAHACTLASHFRDKLHAAASKCIMPLVS
jgi:hypothetical protein